MKSLFHHRRGRGRLGAPLAAAPPQLGLVSSLGVAAAAAAGRDGRHGWVPPSPVVLLLAPAGTWKDPCGCGALSVISAVPLSHCHLCPAGGWGGTSPVLPGDELLEPALCSPAKEPRP